MSQRNLDKAALRGEPSYIWRAGQQRRLEMIARAAGERIRGEILENGCGVGMYVEHLAPYGGQVIGLEYDFERAAEAGKNSPHIINAAGESIPLPASTFDLILSHEVIEHVQDDRLAIEEPLRNILRIPPEVERYQKEKLARVKKERDSEKVRKALASLKAVAQGTGNVVPPILEAVKAYATVGEVSATLREVFGEYRER